MTDYCWQVKGFMPAALSASGVRLRYQLLSSVLKSTSANAGQLAGICLHLFQNNAESHIQKAGIHLWITCKTGPSSKIPSSHVACPNHQMPSWLLDAYETTHYFPNSSEGTYPPSFSMSLRSIANFKMWRCKNLLFPIATEHWLRRNRVGEFREAKYNNWGGKGPQEISHPISRSKHKQPWGPTTLLRATSICILKTSKDGDRTTLLSNRNHLQLSLLVPGWWRRSQKTGQGQFKISV